MFAALMYLAIAVSDPSPLDIYERARSVLSAESYPHFLTYRVTVSGDRASGEITNTYQSLADTSTGDVKVRATSAEETAHPYVPRGVNVNLNLKISYSRHPKLFVPPNANGDDGDINLSRTIRATAKEQYDLLGVPLLSPTYSFGLRPQTGGTERPPYPIPSALKTIASVTATTRDYDISYDGTEAVDGFPCYRLQLTPLRDPSKFRLRRLWIDEQTFSTHQAIVQGNFTAGPGPMLPWLIQFTVHDDRTFISKEIALVSIKYLGRSYSRVAVTFSNIAPSDAPGINWNLSMFKTSGDVISEPPI